MGELNEIERGQLCQSTIESLYEATGGLRSFPGLLKKIIANKAWERRVSKGKVIELSSLRELITEKPVRGWGEDPKKVEAVIKDDPEALTAYRAAMLHQGERADLHDNVIEVNPKPDQGNSKSYTLSRLERDHGELFQQVCDGELSANAAAIKAGFRKVKTPAEQLIHWWKKASADERGEFMKWMGIDQD